ncbi:DUF6000 family protein [Streptomyces massasporeus]|uniref:DUF6000 family protein n=1 Tax=Streptomyces massasporeus TaxID=67324 RepID=UPI003331B7D7
MHPSEVQAAQLLDARLGASQAARFLGADGLWQQWGDGPPIKDYGAPNGYREFMMRASELHSREPITLGAEIPDFRATRGWGRGWLPRHPHLLSCPTAGERTSRTLRFPGPPH